MMTKFTEQDICRRFNCTPEQVRAMHAKNAEGLRAMLAKAEKTGKKVNGYTAEQLRRHVAETDILAQGGTP